MSALPPMKVPERVKRVMGMLSRAAAASAPCPTNRDIADAVGAESISSGANFVALLETMGLIAVERFGAARVVTITSTGHQTQAATGKAHWSARGVKKSAPRKRAEHPEMLMPGYVFRGDPPSSLLVDRDPCPRCGVRRDIGCGHSRAPIATGMSL